MAFNIPNPFAGQTTQPQQPPLPRVPWGSNPLVTMMGLGMLGGRNINEGLQNAAQMAPAGIVAKSAMQRDMLSQQEKASEKAAADARKAQMNELLMAWPSLSQEERQQRLLTINPEIAPQYLAETMKPQETYRPLTDPAERAKWGILPEDTAPYAIGPNNKPVSLGGASTKISLNDTRLTEGQSKDINYYSRGRAADLDLGKVEKSLTELDQSLWSGVPVAGNYALTSEYQVAQRAARDFLAMVLRKDTGAAVTPAEFALYGPTFIPEPGDGEDVLRDKREARDRAMDAIKDGLGDKRGLADEIDSRMAAEAALTAPAEGFTQEEWDLLTPEERAQINGG
jgi:hypothetical protein